MKKRHIEALGYTVVNIPYWRYSRVGMTEDIKVKTLRSYIIEAVNRRTQQQQLNGTGKCE
jgi:hypothetical protein